VAVSKRLVQLGQMAAGEGVDEFQAVLALIEKAAGFSPEVMTLKKVELTGVLLGHIGARRPILDAGAPLAHGALTHRIQWALIALNSKRFTEKRQYIADVDAYLADPESRKVNGPKGQATLWDVVLDAPYPPNYDGPAVANARSPEFLMTYMRSAPDESVKRLAHYSSQLSIA
jgi:hypothetical protein